MSINKIILLGRVGKEPEIRTMNNGNEVAIFNLATSETWKDKQTGQKKESTEWHRVVIYSKGLVGIVKQYVHKGSKLYLEGTLRTKKFKDKQGADKTFTEITLQGFNCILQIVDSKKPTNDNNQNFNREEQIEETYDDEIPY